MNRDDWIMADPAAVARGTAAVANAVQDMPAHVQLSAMAAAFIMLAEHRRIEPQDAFTITSNIMNYAEGRRPEFKGVAQYMENEL
jgi:hypothetical protein